jgi:hypothetical protein
MQSHPVQPFAFNTGRMYAANGQVIGVACGVDPAGAPVACFVDWSRGIKGVVDLDPEFDVTPRDVQATVLRVYDAAGRMGEYWARAWEEKYGELFKAAGVACAIGAPL